MRGERRKRKTRRAFRTKASLRVCLCRCGASALFFQRWGKIAVQFPVQPPIPGHKAPGILQDTLDVFILEGVQRFVAGLEIEDFAVAPVKAAGGAEHISRLVPADGQQRVRGWDIKAFAVHFLGGQFKPRGNAPHDGMGGLDNKNTFLILHFMPAQGALGAHQPLENAGFMAGMQHDQPHAPQHPLLHPGDNFIGHLAVLAVAPPDQDVRIVQNLFRQPGLRLGQGGGAHGKIRAAFKNGGHGGVQPLRVYRQHGLRGFLQVIFIPNGYMNSHIDRFPSYKLSALIIAQKVPGGKRKSCHEVSAFCHFSLPEGLDRRQGKWYNAKERKAITLRPVRRVK